MSERADPTAGGCSTATGWVHRCPKGLWSVPLPLVLSGRRVERQSQEADGRRIAFPTNQGRLAVKLGYSLPLDPLPGASSYRSR